MQIDEAEFRRHFPRRYQKTKIENLEAQNAALLDLVEEALILIEGRPEHACERFEAKAKEMIERVKKN
mgnify:CR=1 FL=1